MKIDICFSPMLYPAYHNPEAVVVVVDVFRATTTMATAFHKGVKSIRPVATTEKAEEYKRNGWLVGAERNVKRCDFADFGNSPFDYTREKIAGKDIVFTTTNGTKSITIAREAHRVITGAFVNIQAVVDYCWKQGRDVTVLCSGWNDRVNVEDTLFGGALAERLIRECGFISGGDSVLIAVEMWNNHKDAPISYLQKTEHYERLLQNHLEDSIPYCLTQDIAPAVPELKIENNRLILYNHYE